MRSKLFVPAVRTDLFPKAMAAGADAVCFDLEDGVNSERKDEARRNVSGFLSALESPGPPALLARVNPATSQDLKQDLNAIVSRNLFAIALPKVETVSDVEHVEGLLAEIENQRGMPSQIALLLTIETPRGLRGALDLAQSSSRIVGLQLGFADLLGPLGISSAGPTTRNQIRLTLRLAASEANVECYESAYPSFEDEAGYLIHLEEARSLGFAGASCIHPKQVALANRVFTATREEIEYARGVLSAAEEAHRLGSAIARYQGKMIDRPLRERALAILSSLPEPPR